MYSETDSAVQYPGVQGGYTYRRGTGRHIPREAYPGIYTRVHHDQPLGEKERKRKKDCSERLRKEEKEEDWLILLSRG